MNFRRIKYNRFIPQMIKPIAFFSGLLLFVISCESTEKVKETISEEHVALLGTWHEVDSTGTVVWSFDRHEVKWEGFSHFYEVSGDSLIISGVVYQIVEQSDSIMKILKLNGKPCTLNRKD